MMVIIIICLTTYLYINNLYYNINIGRQYTHFKTTNNIFVKQINYKYKFETRRIDIHEKPSI